MRKYNFLEYLHVLSIATLHSPWFYKNPYRCPQDIRNYQFKRIKNLLFHAYENTELYHKKYRKHKVEPSDFKRLEDIEKFPTLTKDEVINYFPGGSVAKNVNPKSCILSVSSGSSGKVINIFHRPSDTWAYVLGRFRILNLNNNYYPFDKSLYIYTSSYPAQSYFGLYKTFFIPTLNDLEDTARKIKKIKPNIISSYPSQMLALREYIDKKSARKLPLKLISVGSELSSRKQRDDLEEHFGCPVYDEYSSEELGWIAGECVNHNYHLWEDISFIEILKTESDASVEQGNIGEIVGTNLHNYAMPFIRYRQGDVGNIATKNKCICGKQFRILESFVGRKNDEFIFSNNKKLTSAYLLDISYSLLLEEKIDFLDFCMIQERKDNIKLEVIPGRNFSSKDITRMKRRLRELFPKNVTINIVPTTLLYKTIAGKRNPIISEVSR